MFHILGPDCERLYGNQQNIKMYSTSATAVKCNPSVNAISPCKSNHLCNIQFLEEQNLVFFLILSDGYGNRTTRLLLGKNKNKIPPKNNLLVVGSVELVKTMSVSAPS